jgi:hypothetical protein
MANCEFYASIFKDALNRQFENLETSMAWEKQLERALPEFYASILVFSVKAKGYFVPATRCKRSSYFSGMCFNTDYRVSARINKSLKPFSLTFQPYLNEIEVKERTLKELASMATMENVKGECTFSSTDKVF